MSPETIAALALAAVSLIAAATTAKTTAKKAVVQALELRVAVLEEMLNKCREENDALLREIKLLNAERLGLLERIVLHGGSVTPVVRGDT